MAGNAYFTNFITAGGNVNVNGELDVSGNTNLRGTVSFAGNIITTMNSFSVKDTLGNFLINAYNWAGSNTTAISHSVGNRGSFTHFYSPVTHAGLNTDSYQLFWYPSAGQGGQGSTGTVFGLWDLNPVQNYWKINLPVDITTQLDVTNGISIGGAALVDGATTYNLSIPGGTNQRMGNLSLNTINATGNINAGGNLTVTGTFNYPTQVSYPQSPAGQPFKSYRRFQTGVTGEIFQFNNLIVPSKSRTATPNRSESGSVPTTISAPILFAKAIAIDNASGSSGFGDFTVGKSPFGSACSGTIFTSV
jgi:hypothetical protein